MGGITTSYTYDTANRLTNDGTNAYTWDTNGNMLSDGTSTYTYNYANRMTELTNGTNTFTYAYNGAGDRYQQSIDAVTTTYQLDLAVGLTQVLSDGTDSYLYGLGRIGEYDTQWAYFHSDALGSVRQLTDNTGEVTFAQFYEPYGSVMSSHGSEFSNYGYTGEMSDESGLTYLRARYMNPVLGGFTSRDTWGGDYSRSRSLNRFMYVEGNPVNYTDPSGNVACGKNSTEAELAFFYRNLARLYKYGKSIKSHVRAGYLLPVEGLAQFLDEAQRIYNNDISGVMWATTVTLIGFDYFSEDHSVVIGGGFPKAYDLHAHEKYLKSDFLPYVNGKKLRGDWNINYWDGTSEQARHFWYNVASTYDTGLGLAVIGNNVHDPWYLEWACGDDFEKLHKWPLVGDSIKGLTGGTSMQDWLLSRKGMELGQLIYYSQYNAPSNSYPAPLSFSLGDWVRENLRENVIPIPSIGPGNSGGINLRNPWIPKYE